MGYVVGLDKGTSVLKAVVFDETGAALGEAERATPIRAPAPGLHEERQAEVWAAASAAIGAAIAAAGVDAADVRGFGATATMAGGWLIDRAGRDVRDAIGWTDSRAAALAHALGTGPDAAARFDLCGNALLPANPLVLIRHMEDAEPASLDRTDAWLTPKDWFNFRLCGARATDVSDGSFFPFDIRRRGFSQAVLESFGLARRAALLPEVVDSGAVVGEVHAEGAEASGLRAGTPVVAGMGDGVGSVVGAGGVRPGVAVTVLGTSCMNTVVAAEHRPEPQGVGFSWAGPGGLFLRCAANTAGTGGTDWAIRTFAPEVVGPDGAADFAKVDAILDRRFRWNGPATVIPYFNTTGVLAPFHDPYARGGLLAAPGATGEDALCAAFAGVALATADCYAALGAPPERILLTGGGARSARWARMIADAVGAPVAPVANRQSGALGAALLAGVAAGLWSDLAEASAATLRVSAVHEPDPAGRAAAEDAFAAYRARREAVPALARLAAEATA